MDMNNKKWTLCFLLLTLFLLILGALPTVILDPYFHYHAPLPGLSYKLDNQRYQNDGILKNYAYDAVITGTSMTDNFKTTEFDEIFGVSSIKVAYPGGSYKEIKDSLDNGFHANPNIRYVIRGIDCNRIAEHKDSMNYDADLYPQYLYDSNPFNDTSYIMNKMVLFGDTIRVLAYTRAGIPGTTFDEYNYWSEDYPYGAEAIIAGYDRPEKRTEIREIQEEDIQRLQESILQNFISLAEENPQTQFYYFFTPYSIYWWDSVHQTGETEFYIRLMKEASRMMVEYDNIHLFSFFDMEELICDPNLYKDTLHYSGDINSQMLQWMKADNYRLTRENYASHWDDMLDFYDTYNYDALFD